MIELKIHKESSYIARTNSLQKKYIRQQKYVVLKHSKYFCNLCNDYPEGKIIAPFSPSSDTSILILPSYPNLIIS